MIDSWSKLPIKTFIDINNINLNRLDGFDADYHMVKALTGLSDEEVDAMPIPEFKKALAKSAFMLTTNFGKPRAKFTIDGVEYKINWRIELKTAGQYIDLTHYCKKPFENMHYIMSVLTFFGKYTPDEVEERAKLFYEKLTMDVVYPICLFFSKVLKNSMVDIQAYLIKDMNKKIKDLQTMIPSQIIGGGL